MINPAIPSVGSLRENFRSAKPFKHLCIDNFLIPALAERLLKEFPSSDKSRATNAQGKVSGKATREDVRSLGAPYTEIDDFLSSQKFLHFLSEITGIPDVRYDPQYSDGGTHDNTNEEELDVHVDSNYHRTSKLHRRLKLVIYLNKERLPEWGGGIELHSNPRNPSEDSAISFDPLFNRCVIFETNEYSWHGFSQIVLPPQKRHLSRKSFVAYFYTEARPAEEIAPQHNAFYIPRPLPASIKAGATLTEEQAERIQNLIRQRDESIHFYQKLELSLSAELDRVKAWAQELWGLQRINSLGYIMQTGPASAYHSDGWIENGFAVQFVPLKPISSLDLVLTAPPAAPVGQKVEIALNGTVTQRGTLVPGHPAIFSVSCNLPAQESFQLAISGDYFCPSELGISPDIRKLVANLERVVAHHR
jgi:Rps23 Pro-64 3,4-dihydroxylase Tpa1-like proline 4-hydroxylase